MSRRRRLRAKRRRRVAKQAAPLPGAAPVAGPAASPAEAVEPTPDAIRIPFPRLADDEGLPPDLDRLVPQAALAGPDGGGPREPPELIVEGPDGQARRRARDARDGVKVSDPRRGPLYVGIALFVAVLVFIVLSLIESRELMPSLLPSP